MNLSDPAPAAAELIAIETSTFEEPSILEQTMVPIFKMVPDEAALLTILAALVVSVAVAVWPSIELTLTIFGLAIFISYAKTIVNAIDFPADMPEVGAVVRLVPSEKATPLLAKVICPVIVPPANAR